MHFLVGDIKLTGFLHFLTLPIHIAPHGVADFHWRYCLPIRQIVGKRIACVDVKALEAHALFFLFLNNLFCFFSQQCPAEV